MKIVFFSQDDELEEFLQEAQTSADVVMTDAEKDAIAEVDEAIDDEIPVALFLDFDTDRKVSEKLNKHFLKVKEVARIIFTESMSVKELKKHQDSKLGANAYMRKPLGAESISELLEDLGLAQEAVFDFEADELLDSIASPAAAENDHDDEDSSESQVNFAASEMKMDTRVRYQLDRHNFNPEQAFDFKSETNARIQAIFDIALGEDEEESVHEDEDNFSMETHSDDDLNMDSVESSEDNSIVFEFGEAEQSADEEIVSGESMSMADDEEVAASPENPREILEQMESEREASLVGYRPPDLEATGDIEIPDEFRNATATSDEEEDLLADLVGADEDSPLLEEEGALEFGLPEGDESPVEFGSESDEDEVLDLGADDGEELSLTGDDAEASSLEGTEDFSEEDEGMSLDMGDDEGALEFSNSEDDAQADSQSDDDEFGSLDFNDDGDDEDIAKTVVMNTADAGLNFAMGEAEVEGEGEGEGDALDMTEDEVNLDDALSDVTEESLAEFDYTGAGTEDADLSASEVEDEFSGLEDFGVDDESTDPTILASATSEEELNASLADDNFDEEELDHEELGASADEVDVQSVAVSTPKTTQMPARSASDPILVQTYAQEEMVRHQGLIKQLREEREDLLKQITELKTSVRLGESENLGLRAELDELKIEKSIMKKRSHQDVEEMRYSLKLADEKREIYEERSRKVQKEFDKLNHKVRIDFNTVKQREKELEGQLELLKMDASSQVESRDKKILELKRKIDALEFNMENAHIKEQKSKEDKVKLEEKLHKVMKTLRSSIKVMEDDLEIEGILSDRYEGPGENETSE